MSEASLHRGGHSVKVAFLCRSYPTRGLPRWSELASNLRHPLNWCRNPYRRYLYRIGELHSVSDYLVLGLLLIPLRFLIRS